MRNMRYRWIGVSSGNTISTNSSAETIGMVVGGDGKGFSAGAGRRLIENRTGLDCEMVTTYTAGMAGGDHGKCKVLSVL
jgi:hypothetical protein